MNYLTKYLGSLGSQFLILKDLKIKIFFQQCHEIIALGTFVFILGTSAFKSKKVIPKETRSL